MDKMEDVRFDAGLMAKDILDRTAALAGLVVFSPVFLVLIWQIGRDGGPVFYAQTRIGKNGKRFKCWKFRSMIVNADTYLHTYLAQNPEARREYAQSFKLKNDPRVTRIGRIIRKYSLDELPQFYNVLKGEMSLVGPRPIVEAEIEYYGDRFRHYLSVKPGITGIWQVSGRSDITYNERVLMDASYVDNWTIWKDVTIILKTFQVLLQRKGAY